MVRTLVSLALALGLTFSAALAADPEKPKPSGPCHAETGGQVCRTEGRSRLRSCRRQAAVGCGSTGS